VVILEGCTVELSDHEDGFTFMLNFPGSSSRTYVLSAETQEDMEAWMKVKLDIFLYSLLLSQKYTGGHDRFCKNFDKSSDLLIHGSDTLCDHFIMK